MTFSDICSNYVRISKPGPSRVAEVGISVARLNSPYLTLDYLLFILDFRFRCSPPKYSDAISDLVRIFAKGTSGTAIGYFSFRIENPVDLCRTVVRCTSFLTLTVRPHSAAHELHTHQLVPVPRASLGSLPIQIVTANRWRGRADPRDPELVVRSDGAGEVKRDGRG
jgi:hypothetical protein